MWTHIDTAGSGDERLDLYERNGVYMIRAGGWELMNGEFHASEDLFGRLAGTLPTSAHPAILVGGLGLGYTLTSLIETLDERITAGAATITVAERSGAVIRWFRTLVNPTLAASPRAGLRLVEGDVFDQLGADRGWDVIALDVDNGPAALSTPANGALYSEDGLARCRDSLAACGHLLLWSGFEDADFVERARAARFSVTRLAVPLPNRPDETHVLYVLSRRPLPEAQRERLGLDE